MPLTRQRILSIVTQLAPLCLEFEFKISKPTTAKQIAWRQKQISQPIPEAISDFALHTASRFTISWHFDPSQVDDTDFEQDISGSGSFEFNFFNTGTIDLEAWKPSFTNWQEYSSQPPPFEYNNLLPLFQIINGDLIVSIINGPEADAVYYLDHENGSGDWKRLAPSIDQFFDTLAALWFPDLEWHDSLELFYDPDLRTLSTNTSLARELTAFIQKPR